MSRNLAQVMQDQMELVYPMVEAILGREWDDEIVTLQLVKDEGDEV